MGEQGMADMGSMEMPLPDNTLPMMTGPVPSARWRWAACSAWLKVRRDQPPGDYRDPGWFEQPPGTQAFEWTGAMTEAPDAHRDISGRRAHRSRPPMEVSVRKPTGRSGH